MSTTIHFPTLVANGNPILLWKNRIQPFVIGSESPAHNGKVAIVTTDTSASDAGKPMIVEYRMAKKAHIDAWIALVDDDPFNTTSLASYFSTGHTVIFRPLNPVPPPQNEVLADGQWDFDQDIFDSGSANYKSGFDFFRGFLNLIIVT